MQLPKMLVRTMPSTVLLVWIALVGAIFVSFIVQSEPQPDDFVPFYCASKVLILGDNPYRAGPMASCYADVWKGSWRATRWITPAPLPPLALAAVTPLSRLPFDIAARVWRILILLSTIASAVLLSRMAKTSLAVLLALFVPIGIIENGYNGQPVALILLFIVGSVYALRCNRFPLAAVLATCSLAEPHLGLPACLAMFVLVPSMRLWIASAVGVALILSLSLLPPHLTWEYAFSVLPHQASAETSWYQQYSLTYLFTLIGMSGSEALLGGAICYCLVVATGIFLGERIARRTGSVEMSIFAPVALAVFGGAYIHIFQMIAALPAAVLLGESEDKRIASAARIALFAISIPWMKAWVPGMPIIIVLVGLTLFQVDRVRTSYVTAAFALVTLFPLVYFNVRPIATIPRASVQFSADTPLEVPYARYVAMATPSVNVLRGMFFAKCPTWCGLTLLLFVMFKKAMNQRVIDTESGRGARSFSRALQ